MEKLKIRSAREASLNRPFDERLVDFRRSVNNVIGILNRGELSVPQSLAFDYVFMIALLNPMKKMSRGARTNIVASMLLRNEQWSRDQERDPNSAPVSRGEFNLFRRSSLIERASIILGMRPNDLESCLRGAHFDTALPEVLAYVIWATLAYSNGIVDHHNVDALRGEYPWIPEFED